MVVHFVVFLVPEVVCFVVFVVPGRALRVTGDSGSDADLCQWSGADQAQNL